MLTIFQLKIYNELFDIKFTWSQYFQWVFSWYAILYKSSYFPQKNWAIQDVRSSILLIKYQMSIDFQFRREFNDFHFKLNSSRSVRLWNHFDISLYCVKPTNKPKQLSWVVTFRHSFILNTLVHSELRTDIFHTEQNGNCLIFPFDILVSQENLKDLKEPEIFNKIESMRVLTFKIRWKI